MDILKVPSSLSLQATSTFLLDRTIFEMVICLVMADQNADRIMKFLKQHVFTVVRPPMRLHSDQGRNFDSHIATHRIM